MTTTIQTANNLETSVLESQNTLMSSLECREEKYCAILERIAKHKIDLKLKMDLFNGFSADLYASLKKQNLEVTDVKLFCNFNPEKEEYTEPNMTASILAIPIGKRTWLPEQYYYSAAQANRRDKAARKIEDKVESDLPVIKSCSVNQFSLEAKAGNENKRVMIDIHL